MRPPPFTAEHDGVTYDCEVMDAVLWRVGREDHGIFGALVDFARDGMRQGLGWLALDAPNGDRNRGRVGTREGMDWVIGVTDRLGPPIGALPQPVPCVVLRAEPHGLIRGFALLGDDRPPLLVSDVFGR